MPPMLSCLHEEKRPIFWGVAKTTPQSFQTVSTGPSHESDGRVIQIPGTFVDAQYQSNRVIHVLQRSTVAGSLMDLPCHWHDNSRSRLLGVSRCNSELFASVELESCQTLLAGPYQCSCHLALFPALHLCRLAGIFSRCKVNISFMPSRRLLRR